MCIGGRREKGEWRGTKDQKVGRGLKRRDTAKSFLSRSLYTLSPLLPQLHSHTWWKCLWASCVFLLFSFWSLPELLKLEEVFWRWFWLWGKQDVSVKDHTKGVYGRGGGHCSGVFLALYTRRTLKHPSGLRCEGKFIGLTWVTLFCQNLIATCSSFRLTAPGKRHNEYQSNSAKVLWYFLWGMSLIVTCWAIFQKW